MLANRITCCIVAGALLGLTPRAAPAQYVERWLQETGLSEKELAKLDGGEPLVWVPKADDQTEVTLLAVVRIAATAEDIRNMARDVVGLVERNEQVMQVGVFSDDPTWEDARDLGLPDGDVRDLEKCEVGNCAVRLPARGIESLHESVNWSASDQARQVNGFLAGWLAEYLRGYKEGGSDALAVYADKKEAQSVAEGVAVLFRKTDLLVEYDEGFYRYVEQYPAVESDGVENLFYWTVEDLSLKPTVFLNHMSIRGGEDSDALVVVKQIYASHYIQAGVKAYAVLAASDDDPSQGIYVLLTQRLRFDGKVGGIKRMVLEDGTRKAMRSQLDQSPGWARTTPDTPALHFSEPRSDPPDGSSSTGPTPHIVGPSEGT